MKIKCSCGQIYAIKPEFAGKKLKCKKCDRVFQVPQKVASAQQVPVPPAPPDAQKTVGGSSYWVKPGEAKVPPQNKMKVKKTTPTKPRPKNKAAREQAILEEFSAKDSIEERMANRRRERIEDGRVTNSIILMLKGVGWIVGAVVVFWILHAIEENGLTFRSGRRRGALSGLIAILYFLKGKYWVPPILGLMGAYNIFMGCGSLAGKVDIDDQSWDND